MEPRISTLALLAGAASLAFAVAVGAQQPTAEARQCLDAVASGDYRTAVVLCQRALELDPMNEQLKQALAKAKEGAGSE